MGQLKEIATISTEKGNYLVEMWKGRGRTTSSRYSRPAKLHKETTYDGYQLIEEWSASYGQNKRPHKTNSQVTSEAIKKLRFYDSSKIQELTLNNTERIFQDGDLWIQPNIDSQNREWEVYKIGSKQISHKGNRNQLIEKVDGGVVFTKDERVLSTDRAEKESLSR